MAENEPDYVEARPTERPMLRTEDWWANWIGIVIIVASVGATLLALPNLPKLDLWTQNPLLALPGMRLVTILAVLAALGAVITLGIAVMRQGPRSFARGFLVIAAIAVIASVIAKQATIDYYGLEYVLWALLLGLLIANTVGTPQWVLAGARGELFIKTGLVLMGAEILASNIVALGPPGVFVSWTVAPTSVLLMWLLGTRVLKMKSPSLVMIIACCTSVCGVSAAIASAAACRAKKEELTLAIGITMIFTVIMMIAMPVLCRMMGLDDMVAGAWIGGTVDSTGAVVASGAMLGPTAEKVASVVKMIQNALIGFLAFGIAVYWVSVIERKPDAPRPSIKEIWLPFPKFILGFLGASLLFSFVLLPLLGKDAVDTATGFTKNMRGWLFALAFASIGLESNFRELASQLVGGKPIILYIVGQTLSVLLSLLAAWLAFGGVLFTVTM